MNIEKNNNYTIFKLIDNKDIIDTICVLFSVGCMQDKQNRNGTAHILEHMMVHYISERIRRFCDKPIVCIGKTEFDHILIRLDVGASFASSEASCLYVINEIMNGQMLDTRLFNLSILEVVAEFKEKKYIISEQQLLVTKLTNNDISNHPIGKLDDLQKIRLEDIIFFFQKTVSKANKLVLLMGRDILINNGFSPQTLKGMSESQKNQRDYRKSEEIVTNGTYRYFFPSYDSVRINYFEKIFLMCVLENRYNSAIAPTIHIYEKTISREHRYIYLSSEQRHEISKIVPTVVQRITKKEAEISREKLLKFVSYCREKEIKQNRTSKIDFILRNYLYGDDVVCLDNYDELVMKINAVSIEQLDKKWQAIISGDRIHVRNKEFVEKI